VLLALFGHDHIRSPIYIVRPAIYIIRSSIRAMRSGIRGVRSGFTGGASAFSWSAEGRVARFTSDPQPARAGRDEGGHVVQVIEVHVRCLVAEDQSGGCRKNK
jgi:hypothetical protein